MRWVVASPSPPGGGTAAPSQRLRARLLTRVYTGLGPRQRRSISAPRDPRTRRLSRSETSSISCQRRRTSQDASLCHPSLRCAVRTRPRGRVRRGWVFRATSPPPRGRALTTVKLPNGQGCNATCSLPCLIASEWCEMKSGMSSSQMSCHLQPQLFGIQCLVAAVFTVRPRLGTTRCFFHVGHAFSVVTPVLTSTCWGRTCRRDRRCPLTLIG